MTDDEHLLSEHPVTVPLERRPGYGFSIIPLIGNRARLVWGELGGPRYDRFW